MERLTVEEATAELVALGEQGRERGVFAVCESECDQCLFSDARIVSQRRMADVLRDARGKDTHFVCHKASMKGWNVACAGWHKRMSSNVSRMGERLGVLRFVRVEDLPDRGFAALPDGERDGG